MELQNDRSSRSRLCKGLPWWRHSVPAWAAIISAFAAAAGVGLGLFQLRRVVRSVGIGEQSNTINAISHCAQRYHEIMRDVKNGGRGVKADEFEPGSWWYRYWDLHTEQYTLFRKACSIRRSMRCG